MEESVAVTILLAILAGVIAVEIWGDDV